MTKSCETCKAVLLAEGLDPVFAFRLVGGCDVIRFLPCLLNSLSPIMRQEWWCSTSCLHRAKGKKT